MFVDSICLLVVISLSPQTLGLTGLKFSGVDGGYPRIVFGVVW